MSVLDNGVDRTYFLTVAPRDNKYLDVNIEAVRLRVIRGNVDVSPDVNIKVTDLNKGQKQFVNNSSDGDSFKIDILLSPGDVVREGNVDVSVVTMLNYWIRNLVPLYVVTKAIDIPDGEYIIIDNGSRKQEYDGWTVWSLEFIRYVAFKQGTWKNTNTGVTAALKKYKAKRNAEKESAKSKAEQAKELKAKFKKKCKDKTLHYSKTKKVVECVKLMQQLLQYYGCLANDKKYVDGWYGKDTVKALEKFQKKYKDKHNLEVNGYAANYKTRKALWIGGDAIQVGKTIVIKAPEIKTVGEIKKPEQGDITVDTGLPSTISVNNGGYDV